MTQLTSKAIQDSGNKCVLDTDFLFVGEHSSRAKSHTGGSDGATGKEKKGMGF